MDRPGNMIVFDLFSEADIYKRLGMHGLYRLLKHGEGSEHFPEIRQSETLQWEIDGDANTITLWWETAEDLNTLMSCQVGDFRNGVAINPGYETNPDAEGFYVTARFHQGTVGEYFYAMRGSRRSESLGGTAAKKKALRAAHVEKHGEPVEELSTMVPAKGKMNITMKVSPHTRSDQVLTLKEGKRGLGRMNYTTVVHPALSSWNNEKVTAPAMDIFLVSFSCLSYIYTLSDVGFVGLGLDAPTFDEADGLHEFWCWNATDTDARSALWVSGDARSAMWVMASSLDLHGTFHALTPKGSVWFHTEIPGNGTNLLYSMLTTMGEPRSQSGKLYEFMKIPVKANAKGEVYQTVLDTIVFNLEHKAPWFLGMEGACSVRRYDNSHGMKSWESRIIHTLFEKDVTMTPIQKSIARKMRNNYVSLANSYTGKDGWEYANRLVIRQHLTHANNAARIMDSLLAIRAAVTSNFKPAGDYKHPPAFITDSEFEFLFDWANKRPAEVRAFLSLSCLATSDKAAKSDNT